MAEPPDRTESIFAAAVALATAAERAAYLDQACAGDAALRRRVEALLQAHERSGHLLDRPVPGGPEQTGAYHPEEKPGAVIAGRYKLLEVIGEGGMGAVWVAEQTEPVRRKVALKLIKAGMDSKSVLARFEAERQALAVMDHPNIAKVLDGGLTDTGRPYFVMEYVRGVPITEYCDATRLSVPERLNLFVQVCHAVQHAHQKGIIHRDLKPSNILVAPYDDKPVPKVIDFGLAKAMHQSLTERTLHTAHETVLGTPLYMSPEQAQLNNLDVDTRSDIYSLGVLLYELLTGTTPLEKQRFKAAAWDEVRRIIREEEPPRPSARLSSTTTLPSLAAGRQIEPARLTKLVRGELDWIVMKALEKDRGRRYETANGFAMDLQRHLAGEPVLAAPPSTRYRLQKFARKHQAALTVAATIAVLLVAGVAVSSWQAVRATNAEADALQAQRQETQRAEGERLAKLDADAKRVEAERQKIRAEAGEKLAGDRLVQVEAEKKNADAKRVEAEQQKVRAEASEKLASERLIQVDAERKKAEEERQIAQAVRDFLQGKLLLQADTRNQADALLRAGGRSSDARENPTIRELLDRAAMELSPEKLEANFPKQPLVQAEILHTVGETYRGVGESKKAIGLLQRSAAIRKLHLGPDNLDALGTLHNLALAYQADGQHDLALPILKGTLNVFKAKLGPDDPVTLRCMNNLGFTYHATGQWDLALPLYEKTLDLRTRKLGPDDPDTLRSMNNLADAYLGAGKFKLALPLCVKTLKLRQEKLGPDHVETLASMNNLAYAYQTAGQRDVALPLYEETFKLFKTKRGPDHPETLAVMTHLGIAYQEAGSLDLALPLFEETLKLSKAKRGPLHPDTLTSMSNLAGVYRDLGRVDESVTLNEEAMKLSKDHLGRDHPDTLASMNNLALSYQFAKRMDLAVPLFEQTLKLMKPKLGHDHPVTLVCMENLAGAYRQVKKLDLALPLYEETLKLLKSKLGHDHPDTLRGMNGLAAAYWSAKQLDKSIPIFEDVLKVQEEKFGRTHPDTLVTVVNLGVNYRDAHRLAEALPLLEEGYAASKKDPKFRWVGSVLLNCYIESRKTEQAAELAKKLLADAREQMPMDRNQLAQALAMAGMCLLQDKNFAEAETILRECLTIREKDQPNVWSTFNTKSQLGGTLLGQKKYTDAEPLLLAGYKGMKEREKTIPAAGKIRLSEAVARLVQLYEAMEKKDEAARWRTVLDAIKDGEKKAEKQP